MPYKYNLEVCQNVATRMSGGQSIEAISATLGIPVRTLYRMKKTFAKHDGGKRFEAPQTISKRVVPTLSRDQIEQLADIMANNSKITLTELQQKAIDDGIFPNAAEAPDISTIHRKLTAMGYKWQKPNYTDPRAESNDVIKYERCMFRKHQQNGWDPTGTLLSMDECNFYYEQATRAWGTKHKPPSLTKPKGKIMRRSMFATIGNFS